LKAPDIKLSIVCYARKYECLLL